MQNMPQFITYSLQSASPIGNTVSANQCADAVPLSGCKMVCQSLCRNLPRPIGAGITVHDIESRNLPLPRRDFLPETIEEQIICYADKFYSKSHPERERSIEQTIKSLRKFGEDGVLKFCEWARRFEGWQG